MKIKKQIIEWGIILSLFGGLYYTGYYKEVAGFMQRLILETRLLQPERITSDQLVADYQFQLLDENGQTISFTEFKGQTIVLNFWATWCPPCIAEMPDLNSLYNKTKEENIAFVLISLDEDFEKAIQFKNKKDYDFPVYSLASPRPAVFKSQSIPTTFVISPEGQVIAQRIGMAKYDTDDFRKWLIESSQTGKTR
ncbi:Peroxiredoxin [Reichenbachiella agariperforans]|uniref:Peroxiredoxin n=1 Tax=Reichenbachiella agariperforans TaxID=156994 RepID=A0A1M6LNG2_REIAG|nr:TlpA disulfide reductase family protein [Reichenbachiella agariperforans]SHJ72683.1 Peroxiredoxin [Reichenbachiella agariperforans]